VLREEKVYQRNDERILGDGDFVGRLLASAEEAMEKRYALRARGVDLASIAFRVSEVLGVKPEQVWSEGKYRRIVEARSLLCYWAARELGVPMSSLARKLGISIPSVSESVTRGRRIAEIRGCLWYCQRYCVKFVSASLFRKGRFVGTFPMGFDLHVSSILRQMKASRV
jgi:hypothetical protein